MAASIPFNRPFVAGKELFYISQAVLGGHLAAGGEYSNRCERWMEDHFGARRVLMTHSCTAALEMAALLADIQPGDEVIVPSFTFVSTASAFALRGATLRFVDIDPQTLNMDPASVARAIDSRTRAIVPVHYAGVACDMDALLDLARRHDLLVIEDAAQAVNATLDGRALGTLGHLGCYSFHETKNFISGEGGALVVNDERLVARAEVVLHKGTNRTAFARGEVDRYTWVGMGSSFGPSELTAAFLYAQLEESDTITRKRRAIWTRYHTAFAAAEEAGLLRRPVVPPGSGHNAHMYYLILPTNESRDRLIDGLRRVGVQAVFHYVPLHTSPMGRIHGRTSEDLEVTTDLADRLVRLPCYYSQTPDEQQKVITAVEEVLADLPRREIATAVSR